LSLNDETSNENEPERRKPRFVETDLGVLLSTECLMHVPDLETYVPIPVELRYEKTDAYHVKIIFGKGTPEANEWGFGRGLMFDAQRGWIGSSELSIYPCNDGTSEKPEMCMDLRRGRIRAHMKFDLAEWDEFARRTTHVVSIAGESAEKPIPDDLSGLPGASDDDGGND